MIGEFISRTGPFGLEWSELRNVSPSTEVGRGLFGRGMQHIRSNGQFQRLQQLKAAHDMATQSYTPKVPNRDTSGADDTFFAGSFDALVGNRSHQKMFIFNIDNVTGRNADASLVAKLKRVEHALYMARIRTPDGVEVVQFKPQDFYFLGRMKLGILEGDSDPIWRLKHLLDGNPFSLELLLFVLPSKEIAQAAEKFWHRRFTQLRVKGEWHYMQIAVAEEWFNGMYNFITKSGTSPLNDLTLENWNDGERQGEDGLVLPDEHLFSLDRAIRTIIPFEDITISPLTRLQRQAFVSRGNTSLSSIEWTNLLRRVEQVSRENPGWKGGRVISSLATDPYLLFHLGRSNGFVAAQLRLAFPRMSVTENDFRKSSAPGQMLFDSLSVNALDGSTYTHLRWDSLHPNWPLLISNAHEQWVIRRRRNLSVM